VDLVEKKKDAGHLRGVVKGGASFFFWGGGGGKKGEIEEPGARKVY